MDDKDGFLKAYHDFRNSVDLDGSGILPDEENLVWYILMGVPPVPADRESAGDAPVKAVDQRVTILKALFVEANRNQNDEFIDEGLRRYDQAGKRAKVLITENTPSPVTNKKKASKGLANRPGEVSGMRNAGRRRPCGEKPG